MDFTSLVSTDLELGRTFAGEEMRDGEVSCEQLRSFGGIARLTLVRLVDEHCRDDQPRSVSALTAVVIYYDFKIEGKDSSHLGFVKAVCTTQKVQDIRRECL